MYYMHMCSSFGNAASNVTKQVGLRLSLNGRRERVGSRQQNQGNPVSFRSHLLSTIFSLPIVKEYLLYNLRK